MKAIKNNIGSFIRHKQIKMAKHAASIFLGAGLISCGPNLEKNEKARSGEIEISWIGDLAGDFSFTKNWDYPEGIYKNNFGQLSCSGLCPPETAKMQDENGKIYEDSLEAFYKLVDTTHQFHSIQSDAWAYEWAGTDFATATKIHPDTTVCFTHASAATHSNLILTIAKDKCIPVIELNSAAGPAETKRYTCKSGQIEIEMKSWKKGILKASFGFVFNHAENPSRPMYWKGKIYTHVNSK
ncbi:MAG TPA: hypothetical protein VFR70_06665 [Flavobacterium sp.]|nr:hypothetical protein [Flavobacterium sp.]